MPKARPAAAKRRRTKARTKPMSVEKSTVEAIQRRHAEAEEPLPYIPYRPVPEGAPPSPPPAAQRTPGEAARLLSQAMEASRQAVEALRLASESAPAQYDVAVRARLHSLAVHLESVAEYVALHVRTETG